jgi:hypothetical protein
MAKKRKASPAKGEAMISMRLPQEMLDRASALVPLLKSDPEMSALPISRVGVLRLAIVNGLEGLEEAYGGK